MKAAVKSQIRVEVPNRAGQLSKVLNLAGKSDINILAYVGYGMGKTGFIHLVTENNNKLSALLKKAGFKTTEEKVVLVTAKDKVGHSSKLAAKLAGKKVNLQSVFATAAGGKYNTVLQSANPSSIMSILK